MNHYSATKPLLFNKRLVQDLGLDCPYEHVRNGTWTIDVFGQMGKAAISDLDGSGRVTPQRGRFGYQAQSYTAKNEDDIPFLAMNNERFINTFNKIFDILHSPDFLYDLTMSNHGDRQFLEGRALFFTEVSLANTHNLRNMEDDYGILPHPKFDNEQEHYWSSTGLPHVMCIPITNPELDRTGIILEALCYESYKTVRPEYYETLLKTKLAGRDDESADMLDLIFGFRIYELGRMYWDGVIANTIAALNRTRTNTIVSTIEANLEAYNTAINTTVDVFMNR
jgi:hypothetical protein